MLQPQHDEMTTSKDLQDMRLIENILSASSIDENVTALSKEYESKLTVNDIDQRMFAKDKHQAFDFTPFSRQGIANKGLASPVPKMPFGRSVKHSNRVLSFDHSKPMDERRQVFT